MEVDTGRETVPEMVLEAGTNLPTLHPHALTIPDILTRKSMIEGEIEKEILRGDRRSESEKQQGTNHHAQRGCGGPKRREKLRKCQREEAREKERGTMRGEMTRGIEHMIEKEIGGTSRARQRGTERSAGHVTRCLGDIQPLFLTVSLNFCYLTIQVWYWFVLC